MLVGRGRGQFCSSLTVSAMCQSMCIALAVWFFPGGRLPQSLRPSNFATIRVLPIRGISYQPIVKVGAVTGERTAPLPGPPHPSLSRAAAARESTEVESWAAPVIGNPELGFAAPLTVSSDQPSRPVETSVGDLGILDSVPGSPRSGHGIRNGFIESGFGNGYGGGQKHIDREPVRIISKPTPIYTELARNKKIEGDVVIDLIFTADRRIIVVRILRTLGFGLDETAVQAVSEIVFRPATENGRAVDFEARARVEFRLVPLVDCDQVDGL